MTERSELLLGPVGKGRINGIMVTLDSSDIYQNELIHIYLRMGWTLLVSIAHITQKENGS